MTALDLEQVLGMGQLVQRHRFQLRLRISKHAGDAANTIIGTLTITVSIQLVMITIVRIYKYARTSSELFVHENI